MTIKKKKENKMNGKLNGWLFGWKDIGCYLGCGDKTARYYASKFRLPIERLPNGKPMAQPIKIDIWIKSFNNSHK